MHPLLNELVGYVAGQFAAGKAFADFTRDFSDAAVAWIRPVFLRDDGTERDAVRSLRERPESPARTAGVTALLAAAWEDDPATAERLVTDMVAQLRSTETTTPSSVSVVNSRAVNTGTIDTGGGDVNFGDDNSLSR